MALLAFAQIAWPAPDRAEGSLPANTAAGAALSVALAPVGTRCSRSIRLTISRRSSAVQPHPGKTRPEPLAGNKRTRRLSVAKIETLTTGQIAGFERHNGDISQSAKGVPRYSIANASHYHLSHPASGIGYVFRSKICRSETSKICGDIPNGRLVSLIMSAPGLRIAFQRVPLDSGRLQARLARNLLSSIEN